MFSVRPETPWCGSAQSIVSLFKNKNRRGSWNQAGKTAFVFPAAALDLLISKRSTICLPKKKKGGPPRRVKNLDPPTRTSFPHADPGGGARAGRRPWGRGRTRRGLLRRGISSGAESKQPKALTPGGRKAAPRKPGLGRPRTRLSSPPPEPVVKAETMERALGDTRRRDGSSEREGRAGRRGERKKGGSPRARPRAPCPSPARAPRSPSPV